MGMLKVESRDHPPKFSNYLKLMADFANTNSHLECSHWVPLDHGMAGFS